MFGRISINRLTCSIMLLCFLGGCASLGQTTPNKPYRGPYPAGFNELSAKNPLLAKELGKLPELQDGISNKERATLERIVELYQDDPKIFNSAFSQMYQIGIPEVRRYCSPLQALFWYAHDGELNIQDNPLLDYSLEKLLEDTWNLDEATPDLSEEEVLEVINGIRDKEQKRQFLKYIENGVDDVTINTIYVTWENYPKMFSRKARKTIEESTKKDPRWNEFNLVVDRLNAPQLIDYYERKALRWVDWRSLQYYPVSVRYVFKEKKGSCRSFSDFTVYCLERGGFSSEKLAVDSPPGAPGPYHWVCQFEMDGKKYVMDNGRPGPKGILPYEAVAVDVLSIQPP